MLDSGTKTSTLQNYEAHREMLGSFCPNESIKTKACVSKTSKYIKNNNK